MTLASVISRITSAPGKTKLPKKSDLTMRSNNMIVYQIKLPRKQDAEALVKFMHGLIPDLDSPPITEPISISTD